MIISNIYLTEFIILVVILLSTYLFHKILRNISITLKTLFNLKNFFVLKKRQNYFYDYERFKKNIIIRKKRYFNFQNYFFLEKKLNNKYLLKNKIDKVIVIFYSLKSKYFDYRLNKKKFIPNYRKL